MSPWSAADIKNPRGRPPAGPGTRVEDGTMNEFTKTKIHFTLALLGSLFALHPFLEKFADRGFLYMGYDLKLSYAYLVVAGLLALCVYLYGMTMVSERP